MSARRKRHTRAHLRFHRDRVVAKRARQARELQWWFEADFSPVDGRLENEQWYIGCHRPAAASATPTSAGTAGPIAPMPSARGDGTTVSDCLTGDDGARRG